jgi:hypothetical protein
MYLRKEFMRQMPFEVVVCAIAHEMAHIVLAATGSPLRDNEKAVDITAMISGFADLYVRGVTHQAKYRVWKPTSQGTGFTVSDGEAVETKTIHHKLGYLSVPEVNLVASLIGQMRRTD